MKPTADSLILLFTLGVTTASAQSEVSAGVTAGAAKLSDTRSEQALTGIVQLQPRRWLTLSALPALVHASDHVSGRAVSSSGPGTLRSAPGRAKPSRRAGDLAVARGWV